MLSRRDSIWMLTLCALAAQKNKSEMFGDAEAYNRFMGRWSARSLLVDFADIPDRGRVLDVGSGTGALAFAITGKKPHCNVVGIDPSKEYIAYAASRNRAGARASFEVGDASKCVSTTKASRAVSRCWYSISFPIQGKRSARLHA